MKSVFFVFIVGLVWMGSSAITARPLPPYKKILDCREMLPFNPRLSQRDFYEVRILRYVFSKKPRLVAEISCDGKMCNLSPNPRTIDVTHYPSQTPSQYWNVYKGRNFRLEHADVDSLDPIFIPSSNVVSRFIRNGRPLFFLCKK